MAKLLEEIASWSIEAKDEDTSVYFFHFNDVTRIENGQKNYVIGRKGTGKTAIAEHIHNKKEFDQFSRILSFKNYPFASLYKFADEDFSRPNQYITIWKYVIYHYICSMMADNELVCSRCDFDLRSAFKFEVSGALSRSVKTITSREYSLSILGSGAGVSTGSSEVDFDFVSANAVLLDFIKEKIDESEYYVIFDELDEDYRDILSVDRKDNYFELLIGLFKAVQNIRAELKSTNVRPLIFLRDDIFDLCRDNDKNKWLDRAVVLKWDDAQLRNLTRHRLLKAAEKVGLNIDAEDAWTTAFSVSRTRWGHEKRKSDDTFKYILSRTFARPRDVISYIRECARIAASQGLDRIDNSCIKDGLTAHSAYMRREIIDELFPVLDDVSEVLDVIARIKKITFSRKEFNDRYREMQKTIGGRDSSRLSEAQILKLLFHFNVIGNVGVGGHRHFAYDSEVKVLDVSKTMCVHNGLLKALNIN